MLTLLVNKMNINTFWKFLLVSSLLVITVGFYMLNNLAVNISGDGIPNRPQKEPPIEYPWDQANQIISIMVLSAILSVFSLYKILTDLKGIKQKIN